MVVPVTWQPRLDDGMLPKQRSNCTPETASTGHLQCARAEPQWTRASYRRPTVRGTSRRPRCRPIRIQKRLANDGGGAARANQTATSRMLAGGNLVRRVSRAQSEERHSARSDWEGSLPAATLSRQMRPFSLLWSMLIIAHQARLSVSALKRAQGVKVGAAGQGRAGW